MGKNELKKFQNHMWKFLFGKSFLTLNYKYYQVTSCVKTFSYSHFSSSYRSKEYPPNPISDWGGGTHPNGSLETTCLETDLQFTNLRNSSHPGCRVCTFVRIMGSDLWNFLSVWSKLCHLLLTQRVFKWKQLAIAPWLFESVSIY